MCDHRCLSFCLPLNAYKQTTLNVDELKGDCISATQTGLQKVRKLKQVEKVRKLSSFEFIHAEIYKG
jgi:hypothetical protein